MKTDRSECSSTAVLVASKDDDLERIVRSIRPGRQNRVDRARSCRELRRLMAPSKISAHEADDTTIKIVVLDDDLDMGGGLGLIREILGLRPSLRVIWVARQLDRGREFEARRAGVYYIIPHPLEPTLMERVIGKAVDHEAIQIRKTG